MRFLVTNDDGYDAPGIEALVRVLRELGSSVVVAPLVEHSGCGHRVTTHQPLTLRRQHPAGMSEDWYSLDCTPADCVRVGLGHLKLEVDYVVAGINAGGNLGCDVFISGTVAAAREAALLGVPGIAVSQYRRTRGPIDWQRAERWIAPAIRACLDEPKAPGTFWNLNLPDPAVPEGSESPSGTSSTEGTFSGANFIPPVVECPLDTNPLAFRYEPVRLEPGHFESGDDKLLYRGAYQDRKRTPDCDVAVCFGGAVSMTRLQLAPQ